MNLTKLNSKICSKSFSFRTSTLDSRTSSELKPWQNKMAQIFVGILVLSILFLQQAADRIRKKKIQKSSIPTNIWPFLFWRIFSYV